MNAPLDTATIEQMMRAHGFPLDDGEEQPAWLAEIPPAYALDIGRIATDFANHPEKALDPIECGFSIAVLAFHLRHTMPPGAAYFLLCIGASMLRDLATDDFSELLSAHAGAAGPT